jgi:HPt (histidine-containing phosphotransfer) domain-containing protein
MSDANAAEASTSKLIADLWVRHRPLILERLALLDAAAAASQAGTLNEEQRKEGESTAHKLAGSVGMFGFHQGTVFARELEVEFTSATPDAQRLHTLTAGLRSTLFPPAEGGIGVEGIESTMIRNDEF